MPVVYFPSTAMRRVLEWPGAAMWRGSFTVPTAVPRPGDEAIITCTGKAEPEAPLLLNIPKAQIGEMIAHALETDPEECCGMLMGKGDTVSSSRRLRNVHQNRVSRYTMDPYDILEIEKEADTRGEEFVAIYHSHTYAAAYPSETDVRNAVESGWTDPYYVLISLVEKTRPIVRAYRISDDGVVEEVFVRVLGAGGYSSGEKPPETLEAPADAKGEVRG